MCVRSPNSHSETGSLPAARLDAVPHSEVIVHGEERNISNESESDQLICLLRSGCLGVHADQRDLPTRKSVSTNERIHLLDIPGSGKDPKVSHLFRRLRGYLV